MCGTGCAFIYETGVAVKSQIATQICRLDNNGASRRARKNLKPGQDEKQEESTRYVAESKTRAVVIFNLSVRESRSIIPEVSHRKRDCVDVSRSIRNVRQAESSSPRGKCHKAVRRLDHSEQYR